jgi:hypothetical protein
VSSLFESFVASFDYYQGTPLFMAYEIDCGGNWAFFNVAADEGKTKTNEDYLKNLGSRKRGGKGVQATTASTSAAISVNAVPFRHTPLHDLEPLFWMIIWTLASQPFGSADLRDWQVNCKEGAFSDNSKKIHFLKGVAGSQMQVFLKALVQSFPKLQEFTNCIDIFRQELVAAHQQFQAKIPERDAPEAYADHAAPRLLVRLLSVLSDELDEVDPSMEFYSKQPTKSKRPRPSPEPEDVKKLPETRAKRPRRK